MKILKNTTNTDIDLKVMGVTVTAMLERIIEVEDYLNLASTDSIDEITPYVVSGDLIINDGNRDLDITEGMLLLQYPSQANSILFDSHNNNFISKTIQDAILESTTKTKRNITVQLVKNSTTNDSWLNISDNGILSHKTTWTPPFDCRLVSISFSNKNNTNETKVSAYYKDFNTTATISTGDSTSWYIDSEDANSVKGGGGRQWIYENTQSLDSMEKDKRYGFRITKISGVSMNDVQVTLVLQEI